MNGFFQSVCTFKLHRDFSDKVLITNEAAPQIEASASQFITFVTISALIDINVMVVTETEKENPLILP